MLRDFCGRSVPHYTVRRLAGCICLNFTIHLVPQGYSSTVPMTSTEQLLATLDTPGIRVLLPQTLIVLFFESFLLVDSRIKPPTRGLSEGSIREGG